MSVRVIYLLSDSRSIPTKVCDDPVVFAIIMSEFRLYEQLKVRLFAGICEKKLKRGESIM